MGGGGDSRIPGLLKGLFPEEELRVIIRTYDFDPETGHAQIASWVEETRPDLVIGESLGSVQALRVRGLPHLYVSPSLGAPRQLARAAWLTLLPGGSWALHRKYPVKEGDRQPLIFNWKVLRKYREHGRDAFAAAREGGSHFAFFGKYDHFMASGVVSLAIWRSLFGEGTYQMYDGTHFMEEEFVRDLLVPKIREVLDLKK